ncbi:MAG: hypothetical protein A2X67_09925 [Ignavibacteria bacterium GWA2_55_11]|nr:MAG: hypothetical protein A2X67_09925 [Ignavibacteria bacterium GWA2_55_11]OGU45458.1 MAG: hypothetical protein A2X68_00745 [Ignavibacteria bacterium GWC2_56_12]
MSRRWFQIIALTVIAGLMIMSVGCYGSFELTKKVHKWNGTFGNKWVVEIGFLVLNIVPVYGIAATIDALILNSLEFWTGSNPAMAENGATAVETENGSIVVNAAGNTVTFTDKAGVSMTVEVTAEGAIVRSADGAIVACSVKNADGSVSVYDSNGSYLGSMSRDQIAAAVR